MTDDIIRNLAHCVERLENIRDRSYEHYIDSDNLDACIQYIKNNFARTIEASK